MWRLFSGFSPCGVGGLDCVGLLLGGLLVLSWFVVLVGVGYGILGFWAVFRVVLGDMVAVFEAFGVGDFRLSGLVFLGFWLVFRGFGFCGCFRGFRGWWFYCISWGLLLLVGLV